MPSAFSIKSIGKPFTELIEVDSTNNYAMAQALKGTANHGHAWFAWRQTVGKGNRGKQWLTSGGDNIILSVLLQPFDLPVADGFYLSAAIALSTYHFLKKYAGEETTIKWPNDIYWRDRKAAGILIENSIHGKSWQWSVAGIGININQTVFEDSLLNPVSLKQITGETYDVIQLAKELCGYLQQYYELLQTNKKSLLLAYNEVLYKRNQQVKLRKENVVFKCTVQGVNAAGQLETSNGLPAVYNFGEVAWVIT